MAIKKNNPLRCKLTDFGESTEAVARRCSVKNVLLKISQNVSKHLCQNLFLINLQAETYNFIKTETLTQVFSYEFWKICKNTFFDRTPLVAGYESRSLICQARTVWATRPEHMQRGVLLFMAQEQLPGKSPIKQAKQ